MNLKEAFRYQNKLQSFVDEAQCILDCPANVTKVETTYLRRKVMAEAEDETVLAAPETEYSEQITDIARFLLYLLAEKAALCAAIRQAKDALDELFILGQAVVLQLQIVAVLPEQLPHLQSHRLGLVVLPRQ